MLLVLLALVVATLSAARLTRSSFGTALPSIVFAITLVLYVFSLANALFAGFISVLVLIVGLGVAAVVRKPRPFPATRAQVQSAVSPTVVLFVVVAIVSFILTRNQTLASWDEFTHWGASVKAVLLDDTIAPYNSIDLAFRSYPPATTLFEYFGLRLSGGWSEANQFWLYQLMFLSLFFPFLGDLRWRSYRRILVVMAFMVLTPILIFNAFQVVLVDPYLGLLFGYGMALVFTGDTRSRLLWLQVSLAVGMLALTKDSGFFLAIFVVALFAVKAVRQNRPISSSTAVVRILASIAGPVLSVAFVYLSWKALLSLLKVPVVFSAPIDLTRLVDGTGEPYWNDVLANFGAALIRNPISAALGIPLSHVAWFVLAAVALVALELARGTRWGFRRDFSALVVILVGSVLYTVGLLVLYLFRFGAYEAVRLAAFERYLGTYWVGVAMFLSLCAIRILSENAGPTSDAVATNPLRRVSRSTWFVVAWLVVVIALTPARSFASFVWNTLQPDPPRQSLVVADQLRERGVGNDDRVWIIAQYSTGYEYWMMRYELMPSPVNDGYWSLGSPKDAADVWTADWTDEQWSAALADFDYVVIYTSSPSFMQEFGSLFDDPSDARDATLFVVEHNGDDVSLSLVR